LKGNINNVYNETDPVFHKETGYLVIGLSLGVSMYISVSSVLQ